MTQWDFYIASTRLLNEKLKEQKRVSLSVLKTVCSNKVCFENIKEEIDKIGI
jgi:hypothetical protein